MKVGELYSDGDELITAGGGTENCLEDAKWRPVTSGRVG